MDSQQATMRGEQHVPAHHMAQIAKAMAAERAGPAACEAPPFAASPNGHIFLQPTSACAHHPPGPACNLPHGGCITLCALGPWQPPSPSACCPGLLASAWRIPAFLPPPPACLRAS